MQGTIRCVVVAGMLVGCHSDDTSTPDATSAGTTGLVVEWSSSPEIPSSFMDDVSIDCARFALGSLRVVGDAGPGDPRTTATSVDLRYAWDNDCSDTDQRPPTITFEDAPTGLYSQVAISLDGIITEAYEIRGRAMVGGEERDFRIEDVVPLVFNVGIDEMVSPGETATISLRINFTHALETVDWSNVDINDGDLELETGDAQMTSFRARLVESFEIESSGSRQASATRSSNAE